MEGRTAILVSAPPDITMQGNFLLNPHAAPYIPLSKNLSVISFGGDNKGTRKILGVSENSEDVGEAAGYQFPGTASVECNIQKGLEKLHVSDKPSSEMDHFCHSDEDTFHDETIVAEKQSMMNDPNMKVDYLLAMFPDYSIESLAELLNANRGDLNETIDLLEQLEYEGDVSEELPETSEVRNNLDPACLESNSFGTRSLI